MQNKNGKLVSESVIPFIRINEDEEKSGVIKRTAKYIGSIPARALRKTRARNIMGRYKRKMISDIDKIISKFSSNLPKIRQTLEDKIASTKLTSKQTSKFSSSSKARVIGDTDRGEEFMSKKYESILQEISQYLEDLIRKMGDGCNKVIEHYAKSINDRIERTGTITGVEFYPEDKRMLSTEWKLIEDDINSYISQKMVEFVKDTNILKLEDLKAQIKQYIEDNSKYHSGAFFRVIPEDIGEMEDQDKQIYVDFIGAFKNEGLKMENTDFRILDRNSLNDFFDKYGLSYNASQYYSLKIIIWNAKTTLILLDKKGKEAEAPIIIPFSKKTRKGKIPVSYTVVIPLILGAVKSKP